MEQLSVMTLEIAWEIFLPGHIWQEVAGAEYFSGGHRTSLTSPGALLVQHRSACLSSCVCPSRNIFLFQIFSGTAKPFEMKFMPSSEADCEFL